MSKARPSPSPRFAMTLFMSLEHLRGLKLCLSQQLLMLLFGSVCVFLALGNGARPAAGPSSLKLTVCSGSSWKWRGLDDQRLHFRASMAVVTQM